MNLKLYLLFGTNLFKENLQISDIVQETPVYDENCEDDTDKTMAEVWNTLLYNKMPLGQARKKKERVCRSIGISETVSDTTHFKGHEGQAVPTTLLLPPVRPRRMS